MNELLDWVLDTVQAVDPVARTLLAGLGIMLETSVLIGLVVPGDTIVLVASTAVDGVGEYFALIAAVISGALIGESIGFAPRTVVRAAHRALATRTAGSARTTGSGRSATSTAAAGPPCSSRGSCRCCTPSSR